MNHTFSILIGLFSWYLIYKEIFSLILLYKVTRCYKKFYVYLDLNKVLI